MTIAIGGLDLFVVLVSYTFGSIALSLLGWALILLITGIMGRMSMSSILVILVTFGAVSSMAYIGSLACIPVFLWSCWYMISGILNKMNEMR
jgi:hypothetical protein